MSTASEPVSNNQTILLGRTAGGTDIDLFVVNYDSKENVYVDQLDLQENGVSVDGSDYLYVCNGEGSFSPSAVTINTYEITTSSITSTQGEMKGTTVTGTLVKFRIAQIVSINAGGTGSVVFGLVNTESISSSAGDNPD